MNKGKRFAEGDDDLENNPNKNENGVKKKMKGPKLRPVVGANRASSRPTSHILSKVIYKVCGIIGRTVKTNCESTEEMIVEIENVNKVIEENEDIIIGSLDIVKWYPSMKIERLIEVIMELLMMANLDLREIDFTHLSIYIATSLSKEDIAKEGLEQVIHRRKVGKRAGITNINVWITEGDKCQWELPLRNPSKL